jgi:hypothetical protein
LQSRHEEFAAQVTGTVCQLSPLSARTPLPAWP